MNIETTQIKTVQNTTQTNGKTQAQDGQNANFSEELNGLKKNEEKNEPAKTELTKSADENTAAEKNSEQKELLTGKNLQPQETDGKKQLEENRENNIAKKIDTIPDVKDAVNGLSKIINELNQTDENLITEFKNKSNFADINTKNGLSAKFRTDSEDEIKKNIGDNLINNDFNIRENKDILPQMNPNMNFGGDGQPFSSLMNNSENHSERKPDSTAKDLAEEAQILSTMAENIAIANKINSEIESSEKVVTRNDGIKKINTQTGITQETIVKFDSIIMNEADVEVFANLVNNGEADIKNLTPEAAQKSVEVSKTLADMLAKAMEDNKPIRIDFDNNISVIIRISRDGKLSADFLPSSQVAEAYLKENLPLLKQRFDDENIEYNELNQRERRGNEKEQQRKKGSDNE